MLEFIKLTEISNLTALSDTSRPERSKMEPNISSPFYPQEERYAHECNRQSYFESVTEIERGEQNHSSCLFRRAIRKSKNFSFCS